MIKKHDLVFDDLYRKIENHYYKAGDKLPSESELVEAYNVSKAPIRQALGRLENLGMIVRQAGKGTFVNQMDWHELWHDFSGFKDSFTNNMPRLSYKTISVNEITDDAAIAEKLKCSLDTSIFNIKRMRLIDGEPLFYFNYYSYMVTKAEFEKEKNVDSFRQFIYKLHRHIVRDVHETITAEIADENFAKLFDVAIGFPLLRIETISKDDLGNVIEYFQYYVNTRIWKYEIDFPVFKG